MKLERVIAVLEKNIANNSGKRFDDCFFVELVQDELEKDGFSYSYGATRFALWHRSWDYVIKFNIAGYVQDYCKREYENYLLACERKVEKIFLKIEPVATLSNGLVLYKQVRYSSSFAGASNKVRRDCHKKIGDLNYNPLVKKARNNMHQSRRINEYWHARAYQIYGKRFMLEVERLTIEREIGDLHNHNIGFLKNRPIILDFAGYFGDAT